MGGRPPKPTAVLKLNGSLDHDKKRYEKRKNEPKPNGPLGEPSEWLTEEQQELWRTMAAEAHWLTSADAFMFELAVKYMADFRKGENDTKADALLINVLNKLGFGPAERSKIGGPRPKEDEDEKPDSPFAKRKKI